MDQRFRGLVDWLFESAETKSAHLMKKATLQSLFALGPTFNKNAYKDKWYRLAPGRARTGVAQASAHGSVNSAPRFCFVSHGQVPRRRLPSKVSATRGFRQSSQKSAGQPSAISEHSCLGAKPHLNPKCERPGW